MNYRNVIFQLGLLLLVISAFVLLIGGWSLGVDLLFNRGVEPRHAALSLLITAGIGALIGGTCVLSTRTRNKFLGRREAMLLVALSWIIGAALSALPFFIWANWPNHEGEQLRNYIDCYFEAMSGLTTTGATVLGNIEAVPPSLLFWRSATHWLGGIGIVVLFVAVLPTLGVGGKRLYRVEAPGPSPEGLQPNIRETARMLIFIYLGMTGASIVLLRLTGAMNWFEAVCHTFSMVSTGGLSTRDASIGAYNNVTVDLICMFFMVAAGVNFAVFYMMARGQWRRAWKDVELRVYLTLKLICISLVMVSVFRLDTIMTTAEHVVDVTIGSNMRYTAFQVIALHTGTGFCTADYDPWPFFARAILIGLMFIGGCGGSTAGGIKVIRFWILIKVVLASLEKSYRPQVVRKLKVAGAPVDEELKLSAIIYVVVFVVLFCAGAVAVRMFELHSDKCDFATAMSASVSCLANVGPGVHGVGPTQNYGWFGIPSKAVLSLLMLLGRLEIFAIIVLFSPRFWKTQ